MTDVSTGSTVIRHAAETPARRRPDALAALTVVVVVAAVAVRVGLAARQSYWTDELFSVQQASGTFQGMLDVGRTEVHTPLHASLLWAWEQLGGTHTAWTRSLSVLLGLATILAAYLGLRRTAVSPVGRWLAVALTAASGFGIVYAQDDRPYALVLLGATGLTAASLARLDAVRAGATGWRGWPIWFAWALLTATAHLLGAVLVGVLAGALAGVAWRNGRRGDSARALGLAAVALVPQLAWLVTGLDRAGFAAGTGWIPAPRPPDVWLLLTTVFGVDGITPRSDGFAWTSPFGVAAVALLLVAGGAAVVRRSRRSGGAPPVRARAGDGGATDRRLGLFLLAVAAATLLLTYLVSQWLHIWTLRNMIVVLPALTWGPVWVATSLPRTVHARRVVASVVLVGVLVSLVPIARDLARPYKTDFRSAARYLETQRAIDRHTTFSLFGGTLYAYLLAADQRPDSREGRLLLRGPVDAQTRGTAFEGLRRLPGRQVVVWYGGIGRPVQTEVQRQILGRLQDPACRLVPIYGLTVVTCP